MRHAVIMAGGAGTRLWPLSRRSAPKQLIPLIAGRSLLEIALERVQGLVEPEQRWICAGEAHRKAIRMAAPGVAESRILGEPTGRDTLAAIGLSAAVIAREDPEAVMAVFTADHIIEPITVFHRRVELAFALVEAAENRLAIFCVEPTYPATGFGYVEKGPPLPLPERVENMAHSERDGRALAHRVARFVEKPPVDTAREYVASGRYGWNSGMFVWRASTILDAIAAHKPAVREGLERIASAWGTKDQARALEEVYPTLEKISVDFAVMEPASVDGRFEVCAVAMDLTWQDVGSWAALSETIEPDAQGNRVSGVAAALLDCQGALVAGDDETHTVAAIGMKDVVIVHTSDATLVMPAERAEELKRLHASLPERLR